MWSNGEQYVGEWKQDKMNGRGSFVTIENVEIPGRFSNDKRIEWYKKNKVYYIYND